MVRSARFERATPCLGGRCSIQLSYDRRQCVYSSRRSANMQALKAGQRSGGVIFGKVFCAEQSIIFPKCVVDIFLFACDKDGGIGG